MECCQKNSPGPVDRKNGGYEHLGSREIEDMLLKCTNLQLVNLCHKDLMHNIVIIDNNTVLSNSKLLRT